MVMIDTNVMTGHESITRTISAGAREQAVRTLPSPPAPLSPSPSASSTPRSEISLQGEKNGKETRRI